MIGLDSRQIYSGMEIGTVQPTKKEQDVIPHHLIGIRSPEEPITSGEYAKLITATVRDIRKRGKEPIICGGSGLYYRAITKGIFKGSISNLKVREQLEKDYDEEGGIVLLGKLQSVDPDYAKIVHPNNRRRLVRALEIYKATGKPPSIHFKKQKRSEEKGLTKFTVFLTCFIDELEKRIRQRTNIMLSNGWIEEVQNLQLKFQNKLLHPLDSIGYRQIIAYLNNKSSYERMVEDINLRTRQYAKRQLQWFGKESSDMKIELSGDFKKSDIAARVIRSWQG